MKNLKNKKGFTIVELVIVIAVIAILAAVLIPTFGGVMDRAEDSAAIQNARNKYIEYLALDGNENKANANFIIVSDEGAVIYNAGVLSQTVHDDYEDAQAAASAGTYIVIGVNGTTEYVKPAANPDPNE